MLEYTLINVLEGVLGVPFDPRWTQRISIDGSTARRLAEALTPFYETFRFPEKDRGEMRPYLFQGFTNTNKPWETFVKYDYQDFLANRSQANDLLSFLKPFLLYSHGVCFLDPLPGLLDYFRFSAEHPDQEKSCLPILNDLLMEYVKISDLIKHGIVVPVSDEAFGFYSHNQFATNDQEKNEIIASLKKFSRSQESLAVAPGLGSLIKEQLWLNQKAENRIDLYFPHKVYMPILQGLLRAASRRYSSGDIYEPFAAGVLADLTNFDTSRISIRDIISIRSEQAFADYRSILKRILQRLQDNEDMYSDLETEFAAAAREEMAECDDKIKRLTKKNSVLTNVMNNADRILIGGAFGMLGGNSYGGALSSGLQPLYDIIRGGWTASPNSAARTSLRHHFLVLDAENQR